MNRLQILRHVATASDPTRSRMLRILARHELTVSELYAVFGHGATRRRR
jgi:DNA-binding transcriptional ArsR family regulator